MKNLILLVVLSLFALPVVCFAEKKLLPDGTVFDLKASTSTTTYTFQFNATVYGGRGELPAPLKDVNVTLFKRVQTYNKKIESNRTDIDGKCTFSSDLEPSKEYLAIYKKEGFTTKQYKFFLGSGYPFSSSFSTGTYLYKNGFWLSNGTSSIFGYIINEQGDDYVETGTKITIKGIITGYRNNVTTQSNYSAGYFSFTGLKPDRYRLKVKNKTVEIDLEKNMTCYYCIHLSD